MNRNYFGLLVLFFVALLSSVFGGGPEPRIPVGSADIADGSVTQAKISSGYNLLTTAEKTQFSSNTIYNATLDAITSTTLVAIPASDTVALKDLFALDDYIVGRLSITVTNGADLGTADFCLKNTAGATEIYDALTKFGVAADASEVNVYPGADNAYYVQNHTAGPIVVVIVYTGYKP